MTASSSLAGRALLAVVLMIGFYILAVAIAAGLIYIPYAELAYAHRIHPKLAILCIIGALAILWSVLPRFDRFESPGPQLTREHRPWDPESGFGKGLNCLSPARNRPKREHGTETFRGPGRNNGSRICVGFDRTAAVNATSKAE